MKTIKLCQRMLAQNETLLTRYASDLNRIWRVLTNVQLMMLRSVFDNSKLAEQLEFCREEAYRLRVENDPSVSRMLVRIAEYTDQKEDLSETHGALVRALSAAIRRLNNIRIERILYQQVNLKTYKWALVAVVVVSAGLIANHRVITRGLQQNQRTESIAQLYSVYDSNEPGLTAIELGAEGATHSLFPVLDRDGDQTISGFELSRIGAAIESFDEGDTPGLQASDIRTQTAALVASLDADGDQILSRGELSRSLDWLARPQSPRNLPDSFIGKVGFWTRYLFENPASVSRWLAWSLSQNVLAFVFLAGLAGGLFSVVARVQSRSVVPGEDVYKAFYILTKPIVGAFGAMLLFILLGGGLMNSELVNATIQPGIKIFGFGILAGFSERFAFPSLR